MLNGSSIASVIEGLRAGAVKASLRSGEIDEDFARLRRYAESGLAISEGWKMDKIVWAKRILAALSTDDEDLKIRLQEININPTKLRKDLANLLRSVAVT